jgi:DNA-binding GntR family transcriptional regulator
MSTTIPRFPSLKRRSGASHEVYAALREAIIRLELPPGSPLSPKDLAQQLGVSVTPVREALLKLADEGLIEVYPQSGTYVTRINLSEACEFNFMRTSLECATVRVAAQKITPEQVDELRRLIAEQRRIAVVGPFDAFLELNDQFHRRIIEISGYKRFWKTVVAANIHVDRMHTLHVNVPGYLARTVDEHEAILDCLAEGDGERAATLLYDHLLSLFTRLDPLMQAHPDFFTDDEVSIIDHDYEPLPGR